MVASISPCAGVNGEKQLTESKEREDSDSQGEVLHVETVKIDSGLDGYEKSGEGRLVGVPSFESAGLYGSSAEAALRAEPRIL